MTKQRRQRSIIRIVIRTVHKGKVVIHGRVFKPDLRFMEYDGRLDWQRFAFVLYWSNGQMEPYVALWGTEESYRSASICHTEEEYDKWAEKHKPGPECVDGGFPWYFWSTGEEYERVCKQARK